MLSNLLMAQSALFQGMWQKFNHKIWSSEALAIWLERQCQKRNLSQCGGKKKMLTFPRQRDVGIKVRCEAVGQGGGTRIFHSLCSCKALISPEVGYQTALPPGFTKASGATGLYPNLPAVSASAELECPSVGTEVSNCGFKLLFGHRILPSNKITRGRPMLKTCSLLCPNGLWGQSSLNTFTHSPPKILFSAQRGDTTCLTATSHQLPGQNYPVTLRLSSFEQMTVFCRWAA